MEKEKKKLIIAYNKLKIELDFELGKETLKKFKILNKAFNLGIKIYGKRFTKRQLAIDFELPYSTTQRILSLRKANKITWKLIDEGKISASKVAMILSLKDITYQDEIIDLVIKNNLSTYAIKKLRIKDYKDIEKTRLQIAVEEGFSRKAVAYRQFKRAISRMDELLFLKKEYISKEKIKEIRKELVRLNKRIEGYIKKLK